MEKEVLMAFSVLGTIGASVIVFTRTISNYILKKKMIEKGYVNDDTQALFRNNVGDGRYSSLKWGLVTLFGGLALILMEFIPYQPKSPLPYGMLAVSISLGFLIYYFIVRKELDK